MLAPREGGRPIRVGVLSNPRSGRNERGKSFSDLRAVLTRHPDVIHREEIEEPGIAASASELVRDGCEILLINGGDGTVQAALTALLYQPTLPLVAIVPGGTTNMTARDVGGLRRPQDIAEMLVAAASGRLLGRVVARPVMLVDDFSQAGPRAAMFFGNGAVYHGIRLCRQHIYTLGVRGELGPGVALGVFLARVLFGGGGGEMFPPLEAQLTIDAQELDEQRYFATFASTLSVLFLGLRPFWGEGSGRIRLSTLGSQPRHGFRAAIPFMRGRPNGILTPENGYASFAGDEIELRCSSGYTLDGELFEPTSGFIRLSTGPTVHFLGNAS